MVSCGTEAAQRVVMVAGGISHVSFPAISGAFGGKPAHKFVAMSLCKNRSSRYRHVFSVSLYNGTVWYVDVSHRIEIWLELVSVDYDVSGTHFETVECELHSRYGCVEDIDSVDFFGLDRKSVV